MRVIRLLTIIIVIFMLAVALTVKADQRQAPKDLKVLKLKMIKAPGLIRDGKTQQNTNWNKICQTPDGRIWFSGGDHWGTDRWNLPQRYDVPWGFGNTVVASYKKGERKARDEFELDKVSAIFSNVETSGHGKIHANIDCDSKGYIYTAGYMGGSYGHEFTDYYFPKSYSGGMIIQYNPKTSITEVFGIPAPMGGCVAFYLDEKNGMINGFSVDRGRFWRVNMKTREVFHYETNGRFTSREMIMDRDGNCYFLNEFSGLTRFNQADETYEDLPIKIPGLRASRVSSKNVIYGICSNGLLWSYDIKTGKVEEYGHVVGHTGEYVYTPNMALDEDWGRLYFIAGGHGVTLYGKPILSIFDLKEKKFYWPGLADVNGCYGALVARDHTVYFSCYAEDHNDNDIVRPFLVEYNPPKSLKGLE